MKEGEEHQHSVFDATPPSSDTHLNDHYSLYQQKKKIDLVTNGMNKIIGKGEKWTSLPHVELWYLLPKVYDFK